MGQNLKAAFDAAYTKTKAGFKSIDAETTEQLLGLIEFVRQANEDGLNLKIEDSTYGPLLNLHLQDGGKNHNCSTSFEPVKDLDTGKIVIRFDYMGPPAHQAYGFDMTDENDRVCAVHFIAAKLAQRQGLNQLRQDLYQVIHAAMTHSKHLTP